MRKTYNLKLVPMDKVGFSINDICTRIKLSPALPNEKVGTTIISIKDYRSPNEQWQAQRLVITNEHGTALASYPNIPDTHQIDLSDIRRWIESGCPYSVELEVKYTNLCESMKGGVYGFSPLLTNNTVKMVWGEQKELNDLLLKGWNQVERARKIIENGTVPDKAQPIAGEVDKVPQIDWEQAKLDFGFFAKVKRNNAVNTSDVIGWIKQYYQFPFKTEINGK